MIIAEIGVNHNGDMGLAIKLIEYAKEAGADIAKFQLYDVDKLFPNHEIWTQGRNWYEEIKQTQLSKQQVMDLAAYCREVDIEFMASAFDVERVGWLEEAGVKRHKVACRFRDKATIEAMVATGRPLIISHDHPTYIHHDVDIDTLDRSYLYCVPEYPAPLEHLKLHEVDWELYDGFSDHTEGIEAAMVAISRGAKIIEKHFTLNKYDGRGPDHICSVEPQELARLVQFAKKAEKCLL